MGIWLTCAVNYINSFYPCLYLLHFLTSIRGYFSIIHHYIPARMILGHWTICSPDIHRSDIWFSFVHFCYDISRTPAPISEQKMNWVWLLFELKWTEKKENKQDKKSDEKEEVIEIRKREEWLINPVEQKKKKIQIRLEPAVAVFMVMVLVVEVVGADLAPQLISMESKQLLLPGARTDPHPPAASASSPSRAIVAGRRWPAAWTARITAHKDGNRAAVGVLASHLAQHDSSIIVALRGLGVCACAAAKLAFVHSTPKLICTCIDM